MTLIRGVKVGSYEIISPVGRGSTGEAYLAKPKEPGPNVVVKVLREQSAADPERLRRIERLALAASALDHPNIITIHEFGAHNSRLFIVMEHIEGRSLRSLLAEGPLATEKLIDVSTQIAEALAAAHSAGIVHRGLKPENVMIMNDGKVKVLDFGVAEWTAESDAEGTTNPGYLSPEQVSEREADFRSDQFSLGAILYEMATGTSAFQRESPTETRTAIMEDDPETRTDLDPTISPRLSAVLKRCLAKRPEDRYAATRDLARELARLQKGPPPFVRILAAIRRRIETALPRFKTNPP